MLRMIDRHAVQQMLTAGVRIGEVARHFEVSRRTIERIRKEPAVEGAEDAVARWKRGVGRPPVPATVRERMRTLIAEDPEAPPLAEHEGTPISPPSSMMPRGKDRGTLEGSFTQPRRYDDQRERHMGDWHDFLLAQAGAAGGLTGLVFVGVSINLEKILSDPTSGLAGRAAEALVLLVAVLTASCLLLVLGQGALLVGIEVLL